MSVMPASAVGALPVATTAVPTTSPGNFVLTSPGADSLAASAASLGAGMVGGGGAAAAPAPQMAFVGGGSGPYGMVGFTPAPTPPAGAAPVASAVAGANGAAQPAATGGGLTGAAQAAAGAGGAVTTEQVAAVLQQLVTVLTQLITALGGEVGAPTGAAAPSGTAQGSASGGGASAAGGCSMPNCTMHGSQAAAGASGAPPARIKRGQGAAGGTDAAAGAGTASAHAGHSNAGAPGQSAAPSGTVSPSSVKDKTSTKGLNAAPIRGLEEAHKYGLPLVSGARPGPDSSDHTHGNAIDVANIAIGAASSVQGSPEMIAYAEHMRLEGKAGRLDVKYVIHNGQIASATDGWAWRPYTYPGKSAAEMEAMKASNRGEYNRMQHYDHVHVSFN